MSVAAYVVVFVVQAAVTRVVFTQDHPGGNDLYPRWAGGCAWILRGDNPYAASTTEAIQRGVYGRLALPGEDQVAFAYPIYVVAFTGLLCFTRDFSVVQAVGMTALIHLLVVAAVLARRLSRWAAPARLWPWVLAWAVLVYPNARAVLLGQLSVVVAALVLGSLYALQRRRDALAGILLALATIKPQIVLLVIPWLLFWSVARRRWGMLNGFAAALAVLIAVPMIWLPSWPVDFLRQVSAYTTYTELWSVTWILTSYYGGLPAFAEVAISTLLMAWLLWEWFRSRTQDLPSMLWTTSLTLVITHFVAPRTATTHFVPLMLPLFMAFALAADSPRSTAWAAVVLSVLLVGTWWLFLATVEGIQESALTYLPIPIALLVLLPWMRSRWLAFSQAAT
ncbi:MAG TPA: glycosyltransferase family 87 protein [Anaerolineales bacterium]|nr:glycosyltransferase family 87 protein [Anaerolineales bacterium]